MDIIEPDRDTVAPKPREALFAHADALANLLRPTETGRADLPPEHAALLRRMARDLDRFHRGAPSPRPLAPAPRADAEVGAEDPRIAELTRRIEALERGFPGAEATVAADALAPLRTLLDVLSVELTRLRQASAAVPTPMAAATPAEPVMTPVMPVPPSVVSAAAPARRHRLSAGEMTLRSAVTLGALALVAGGIATVWWHPPATPTPVRLPPIVTHRAALSPPAAHPAASPKPIAPPKPIALPADHPAAPTPHPVAAPPPHPAAMALPAAASSPRSAAHLAPTRPAPSAAHPGPTIPSVAVIVPTPRPPPPATAVARSMPPASAPAAVARPAPKPAPTIAIRAIGDAWVSLLDASGTPVLSRLMHAGDMLVPPAPGLTLTTGNAGATELVIDGVAGKPLGAVGVVRHDIPLRAAPRRG